MVRLPAGGDAQGDQDGAVEQLAGLADFFVTGVEDHIRAGSQRAGAPVGQGGVELGGAVADLGGTDLQAAEFFEDGGDFAGGDALDIHFGQSQFEGLLTAHALVEGGGIEGEAATDLRDAEGDGGHAGGDGFGFEAVGVAQAGLGAFVRLGLEGVGAFQAHGFVNEQANALGEAFEAFAGEELQDGVQEFRLGGVGHNSFGVGCVY